MVCSYNKLLFIYLFTFFNLWHGFLSSQASPTKWRKLIFHLQHNSLPDVLEQADNLVMAELWQVDAIHGLDVVSYIQLVAPEENDEQIARDTKSCRFTGF